MNAQSTLNLFLDVFIGVFCDTEFYQEAYRKYVESSSNAEEVEKLLLEWSGGEFDNAPGADWCAILKTLVTPEMNLDDVYLQVGKVARDHNRYSVGECGFCFTEMFKWLEEQGASPEKTLDWVLKMEKLTSTFSEDYVTYVYVYAFLIDQMREWIASNPIQLEKLQAVADWKKIKPADWEDVAPYGGPIPEDGMMVYFQYMKYCSEFLKEL